MPLCTQTCEMEPFKSQVTPQADDPSSLELFQGQIEEYLTRFREAVCADITCLENQLDALDARVTALETP